jgi:hypothetical protein
MKSATAFKSEIKHTQKFAHRDFWSKIKTLEKPTRGKPVREGRLLLFRAQEEFFLQQSSSAN